MPAGHQRHDQHADDLGLVEIPLIQRARHRPQLRANAEDLGVQRELPGRISLEMSYVGSRTTGLQSSWPGYNEPSAAFQRLTLTSIQRDTMTRLPSAEKAICGSPLSCFISRVATFFPCARSHS